MGKFEIEFFRLENGACPVYKFIAEQDTKMRAKILKMIELLKDYGTELREPYSKYLRDGIYEIRIKQGTNITRVLYFFMSGGKIILTNGFEKKTQKTPDSEIEKARKYRSEYIRRKEL